MKSLKIFNIVVKDADFLGVNVVGNVVFHIETVKDVIVPSAKTVQISSRFHKGRNVLEQYKDISIGKLQQKMLYVKYERTLIKMNGCLKSGNMPMYRIYKKQIRDIRMTLGILGIHIKGINIQ